MRTDRRAEPEKGQATGISHLGVGHLQELAVARLKGDSNAQLDQRFGCTERTIQRRLHVTRENVGRNCS